MSPDPWKSKPAWQPEEPDIEAVRNIAWEMTMSWSFHELAIDDPFKAECQVHDWAKQLIQAVGHPSGMTVYYHEDDE